MSETVAIIGAGHAAGQAVASLRQDGWTGGITLIGEEAWLPYQRPPLSKKYLSGELPRERLLLRPESFYEAQGVDCRLGVRAEAIDRAQKQISLSDGSTVDFTKAIIATGTRPRQLVCPGADLGGVFYLRTIDDVDALRPHVEPGASMVIIGAGYIGLEVAAVASQLGLKVTVIEAAQRVLARVTSPLISDFFTGYHRKHGVDIRLETGIEGFVGTGQLTGVRLTDSTTVDADMAVVGIGILPNDEIAAAAGLKTDNGIWVDEHARTEDPDVFAIGDCTNHPNPLLDHRVRLESVHNALEQAKTAAATICGRDLPYAQIPWFWSDQYDLKLQTAGLSAGHDSQIIRGEPKDGRFSVCYLKAGVVIAVDAINAPADFMAAKTLLANRKTADTDRLGDASVPLKDLL